MMKYEVDLSLEDVRAVANGEPYDTWGEAQVWDGKIGAEYNLCFDEDNCSAIYLMEEGEDGCWSTDVSTFEHYEIDPDDPEWKENLIKAMTEFVDSKSHMNELRTLCKKLKENYSIPYLVGCVYDLFQDYFLSSQTAKFCTKYYPAIILCQEFYYTSETIFSSHATETRLFR